MARTRKNGATEEAPDSLVLTENEWCARYPKQWMLMEITEWDRHTPKAGRLLAHNKDRSAISPAVIEALGQKKPIYVFYGVKLLTYAELVAYQQQMAEKREQRGRRKR